MESEELESWDSFAELVGHSSWIYGVAITSDNQLLASSSYNEIFVWNLKTQSKVGVLEDHTDIISSMDFIPYRDIIVTGSLDKTVKLWDLKTGKLIDTFAKRQDSIYSVAFSPDGKLLATGGSTKYSCSQGKKTSIYLWDIEKRELIHIFYGHNLRVKSLSFSPDGEKIASCSNDQTIKLWNIASLTEIYTLQVDASQVCFSTDGKSLFCSGSGGIKVFDADSGQQTSAFAKENDYIRCFAIDPSGTMLALSSRFKYINDGIEIYREGIEIWDLSIEKKLAFLEFNSPISMRFSFDGKLLAVGDASSFTVGGRVKVWKVPRSSTSSAKTNDLVTKN